MVFANTARVRPLPEHAEEVEASMRRFRDALRTEPGCLGVYVLREAESDRLVGLSLWESREAFDAAMARVPPKSSPTGLALAEPPEVRQWTEAG
jgi:quinol monooxygenase YgiN